MAHSIAAASLLAFMTVTLGLLLQHLLMVGRRPPGYPPGPPTIPILGNLHLMPAKDAHLQFEKWAREYGTIYSLMLGTKTMIVLSSAEAVRDLLDQRSAIYSSRPDFYVGNVASDSLRIELMPYGKQWRGVHRVFHGILNIHAAKAYVPYQDLESKQMLVGILDDPAEYRNQIRRLTFSLTMQMVYGTRASRIDDPALKALFSIVARFEELIGAVSSQLLDLFPVLRHIPGTLLPLRRKAMELRRDDSGLFGGFGHDAKHKIQRGTAQVRATARSMKKPAYCEM